MSIDIKNEFKEFIETLSKEICRNVLVDELKYINESFNTTFNNFNKIYNYYKVSIDNMNIKLSNLDLTNNNIDKAIESINTNTKKTDIALKIINKDQQKFLTSILKHNKDAFERYQTSIFKLNEDEREKFVSAITEELNSSIKELNNTAGTLDKLESYLDIGNELDEKIKSLKKEINMTVEESKKCLNNFQYTTRAVDKENNDFIKRINLQIYKFEEEVSNIKENLSGINYEFETNINGSITRSIENLKSGLDEKYFKIADEYENISIVSNEIELLKEKIDEVHQRMQSHDITDKTIGYLNEIKDVKNKYIEIGDCLEYIDNTVNKFDVSISKLNKNIENNIIKNNSEEIMSKLLNLQNNLQTSYDNFNKEYLNISEASKILYSYIDDIDEKFNSNIKKIDKVFDNRITNEDLMAEIKNVNMNSVEDRIFMLEKKIDYLIEENNKLKEVKNNHQNIDNEFKKDVINQVSVNTSKEYESLNSTYTQNVTFQNQNIKERSKYIDKKIYKYEEIEELKREAKLGYVESSYKLGEIYYNALGVEKNLDISISYFLIGAKKNYNKSKYQLIKIYKEEAEKGIGKYQKLLGMEYCNGVMIEKDIKKARYWLEQAYKNGKEEVKWILDRMPII